jgi:hypothetical protein
MSKLLFFNYVTAGQIYIFPFIFSLSHGERCFSLSRTLGHSAADFKGPFTFFFFFDSASTPTEHEVRQD